MSGEEEKDGLTRRGFLGVSSAALAAAGMRSVENLAGQEASKSDRSSSDPGPTNVALDAANSDSVTPPKTDAGAVQTFKYPFSFGHKRLHEGGWSREVTVRELAVSKTLAGVDMRLTAGGVRELHWHTAAEWAFMLYGNARITCIDADGKSFVTDVKENDLWYFPDGNSALDPGPWARMAANSCWCSTTVIFPNTKPCCFRTGWRTRLLKCWPKILAWTQKALANMPKKELFIFQADVPGPLEEDRRVAAGKLGPSPIDFAFRTMQMPRLDERTKAAKSASLIPAFSKCPRTSPPRSSL